MSDMTAPSHKRRSWFRRFAFLAIALVLGIAVLEVGLRVVIFQSESVYPTAFHRAYHRFRNESFVEKSNFRIPDPGAITEENRIQAHDEFGWTYRPGDHSSTWGYEYAFGLTVSDHLKITIADDGFRVSSADPARYVGKPEIHVFGCSMVFGHGISDEETIPWKMQLAFPNHCVKNRAMSGYGNVQGFKQLERSVNDGEAPKVAVFVYNPFHVFRNYGSPSWLSRQIRGEKRKALIARIDLEDNLVFRFGRIHPSILHDPEFETILPVTMRLVRRIAEFCKSNEIVPVFAVQTGVGTNADPERSRRIYRSAAADPVATCALRQGFHVVNMSLTVHSRDLDPYYRVAPNDAHPNDRATTHYADAIIAKLHEIGIE